MSVISEQTVVYELAAKSNWTRHVKHFPHLNSRVYILVEVAGIIKIVSFYSCVFCVSCVFLPSYPGYVESASTHCHHDD